MSTIGFISDIHAPFEHQDALAFVREVCRHYKVDETVSAGDEGDQHAMSPNHDHDPDGHSAGDEHEVMLEHLRAWYRAFPNMKVCTSNHGARPFRRASKFGIPSVYLRTYAEFMEAPRGWIWRDSFEIDGVHYLHGEGYSGPLGALKCAQSHMAPVAIGHLHSYAGVLFNANPRHLFWGLNAGCLIDRHAYAFAYAKHSPAKPILGMGVIRDAIPLFVPMNLTRTGRWTGEL
jgi:hypothetical protein